MARSVERAHYLHNRRGLTALVRPPVRNATVAAWDTQGYLLVATSDGRVERVHPAMGTRTILEGLRPAAGLNVDEDRFVLAQDGGPWGMYQLDGSKLLEGEHPFAGRVEVQFRADKVLLTGHTADEKQVLFYDQGRKVFRIRLPHRSVAFTDAQHKIHLAQSTEAGLEVIKLAANVRFQHRRQTSHRLRVCGQHVLGVTRAGVRVWSLDDGESVDVALEHTSYAALSHDGRLLAVGTSTGSVALVDLANEEERLNPSVVSATRAAIRTLSFSPKGRFIASGADGLTVFTWDA